MEQIIIDIICDYFGIDFKTICTKSRKYDILKPRQICHYFLYKFTLFSSSKIGFLVGNLDHATVLNSINKVNNSIDTDITYRNEILEIQQQIELKLELNKNERLLIIDDKIWEIYEEKKDSYKIIRVGKDDLRKWDEIPKNITMPVLVRMVVVNDFND